MCVKMSAIGSLFPHPCMRINEQVHVLKSQIVTILFAF